MSSRNSGPTQIERKCHTVVEVVKGFSGQFAPLKCYFENLTVDDLFHLSPSFLIESAEPKHRLLMKRLIDKELSSILNQVTPFDPEMSIAFAPFFPANPPSKPTFTLWRPENMEGDIGGTTINILRPPEDMADTIYLDLSGNNLFGIDLPEVVRLVRKLPKCAVVNLSNNRLDGKESSFEVLCSLLDMEQIQFVDITLNPMASVQSESFLVKVTERKYEKLIRIPYHLVLFSESWRQLVKDESIQEAVISIHETYHANYPVY